MSPAPFFFKALIGPETLPVPELPEVETIRRALQASLPGLEVLHTAVLETRLRRPVRPPSLRQLEGQRFVEVGRRGKYLLLWTDAEQALVVHLGMTGRVDVFPRRGVLLRPHDHIRWQLRGKGGVRLEMRYHDPRRFGLVVRLQRRSIAAHPLFARLGPEPLDREFNGVYLRRRMRRSRRPIKNTIMDAGVVVGVGNIYASEALWRAQLNPKIQAGRVGEARCQRLCDAIVAVLREAIEQGGTTLSDYRDPVGTAGSFQVRLHAYGREGRECHRCGGTIRRVVQSSRSTFYCPGCQH